jgi:hypothetical protein
VNPAYDTRENYERWHIRICARCGRQAAKAADWSDGPICRTCFDKATRIHGSCPGCRTERLLPARDASGMPVCRDCAGITRDFSCDRCRVEAPLLAGRLCPRCTLADRLTALLDDGTGRIHPPLAPADQTSATALLQDLATGRLALTHEAFQQLPNWRTAAYLRDILMQCGVCPPSTGSSCNPTSTPDIAGNTPPVDPARPS